MQQPSSGGTWVGKRRLFDHAGHANFRVESPLARGSPDAATSTRWDLGRITESTLNKSAHGNETRTFKYIEYSRLTFTGRIPNRIPIRSLRDRTSRDRSSLGDRVTDHRGIFTRKHDRSCLDMSEADGVDGGAICKRGFIHLQFAAKPEAPEAERHLGSRILE
ncbi:hypothetical protein V1477_009751 [Vespula maculifrons]|uniref:Uncharacterized protein n=1 Tax=Vespula maculifrons TaxID=7453 RepID=A0ABD2CAM8_VESMC